MMYDTEVELNLEACLKGEAASNRDLILSSDPLS